jgi:hypothetical protein
MRFDQSPKPPRTNRAFTLETARIVPGEHVSRAGVMSFELEFELHEPVSVLEVGVHIFDDNKRWAFGINNSLLNQPFRNLGVGRHRLVHTITADLPTGEYNVGFSFSEIGGNAQRKLFWQDETLWIEISPTPGAPGVGHSPCYTEMKLERLADVSRSKATQAKRVLA